MKKLCVFVLMLLVVTTVVFAQEKPTVVIVPFDTVGVDETEADVLFEVFTSEFAGLGNARVVDRNSFDKIKAQHSFQSSDWSNSDKIAQLGKALNANMVVTGQLMSFKGSLVATFRMLDVNTVEIVATATERTSGTDDLFEKLGNMAKKLTANLISSSSSTQKYKIGDEGPGGGIVFYYSEEGFDVFIPGGSVEKCNYLEVSKTEVAYAKWSRRYGEVDGTEDGLGYGKMNTYKICVANKGEKPKNCAAVACKEYYTPQTSKGDWFLPSKDELDLLYKNLGTRILEGATEEWHWSSSQCHSDYDYDYAWVWVQRFSDGYKDYLSKKYDFSVRAIRAF